MGMDFIMYMTCLGRRCGPGSRRSRGRSGVGAHGAGTRCRPCGSARTRWKPWAGRASWRRSRGGASAAAGGRGGRRGTVRKAQAWAAQDRGGDGKPVHTQHDTAKGLRLRGRPLWKGFRVLGPARPRPQGVEVQLERAAHGVAHGGKPSARRVRETGVRKRRRRLARGRSARAGATRADDGTGEGVLRRRVGYE